MNLLKLVGDHSVLEGDHIRSLQGLEQVLEHEFRFSMSSVKHLPVIIMTLLQRCCKDIMHSADIKVEKKQTHTQTYININNHLDNLTAYSSLANSRRRHKNQPLSMYDKSNYYQIAVSNFTL